MAWKTHLWSSDLALATFLMLANLIIALVPTCPSWGLSVIPAAWKRHLWPADLTLVNIDYSKMFPHKCDDTLHALYYPAKFQPDRSSHQ